MYSYNTAEVRVITAQVSLSSPPFDDPLVSKGNRDCSDVPLLMYIAVVTFCCYFDGQGRGGAVYSIRYSDIKADKLEFDIANYTLFEYNYAGLSGGAVHLSLMNE